MLRASSDRIGHRPRLRGIVDLRVAVEMPLGRELLCFTDAVTLRDAHEVADARSALEAASSTEAMLRAAAVAGNFDMMNRLVDAAGIPHDAQYLAVADELGLRTPGSRS